ncbi:DUF3445 domain-containing protein [bacterium]|nr:DUF3445 domain-containing protein [bacterium]
MQNVTHSFFQRLFDPMADSDDLLYFPFDGDPYRPRMGLLPLAIESWIEVDLQVAEQLRLRAALLDAHRDDVLKFSPEAEHACRELNRTLRRHLLDCLPDYVAGDPGRIRVRATGCVVDEPTSGVEALEQLAHLVQEDFCILSDGERPVLIAGLVCFPSHWKLADKFSRSSDEIHADVPGFQEKLSTPTNAILQKVQPDSPVWRVNWTIHDSNALHRPVPEKSRREFTVDNVLDSTWLRIERQTLRRLPETGAIVFTIRTYRQRIADIIRDSDRRRNLLIVLESLPPETTAYKGLTSLLPLLTQALTT